MGSLNSESFPVTGRLLIKRQVTSSVGAYIIAITAKSDDSGAFLDGYVVLGVFDIECCCGQLRISGFIRNAQIGGVIPQDANGGLARWRFQGQCVGECCRPGVNFMPGFVGQFSAAQVIAEEGVVMRPNRPGTGGAGLHFNALIEIFESLAPNRTFVS